MNGRGGRLETRSVKPSLRITGGVWRGRPLRAPRGDGTRPASGRLRLGAMNMLGPDRLEGAVVLDLFAGTGAVGLEALSRGARRAVFVEKARPALEALEANLAALGVGREAGRIVRGDAVAVLAGPVPLPEEPFDLVFCDPPYGLYGMAGAADRLLAALGALALRGGAAPAARLLLEHPAREAPPDPPPGWDLLDRRSHSAAGLSVYGPSEVPRLPDAT